MLQRWLARFTNPQRLEASVNRYLEKSYAYDDDRADAWVQRDHLRDAELTAMGLAEAHASTFEPSQQRIDDAIAAGDLHDFRNPLLSPERHAAICVRCQRGLRSREIADKIADKLGKKAFPGLGGLQQFQDRIQRCEDCGELEDIPAPNRCNASFWHLPDVWLALHPGETLDAMGDLGPFMRGFLRRQRPALEVPADG